MDMTPATGRKESPRHENLLLFMRSLLGDGELWNSKASGLGGSFLPLPTLITVILVRGGQLRCPTVMVKIKSHNTKVCVRGYCHSINLAMKGVVKCFKLYPLLLSTI